MILATAFTELFEGVHNSTLKSKKDYAQRWGMELRIYKHQVPNLVSWERAAIWLDCCEDSTDWTLFIGADAAITNPDLNPEAFLQGFGDIHFLFSCDGNGLQSDAMFMRNSAEMQRLMRSVIQRRTQSPNEQVALQEILSGQAYPVLRSNIITFKHQLQTKLPGMPQQWYEAEAANSLFKLVPLHAIPSFQLQGYPIAMYDKATQNQDNDWKPGYFIAHCPARPLEQRIEWFNKILAEA